LVKEGFLTKYLDNEPEKEKKAGGVIEKTNHEAPILGDFNTIAEGFSGGGILTFGRKRYSRAVMT